LGDGGTRKTDALSDIVRHVAGEDEAGRHRVFGADKLPDTVGTAA
jgi:hypothetical protein